MADDMNIASEEAGIDLPTETVTFSEDDNVSEEQPGAATPIGETVAGMNSVPVETSAQDLPGDLVDPSANGDRARVRRSKQEAKDMQGSIELVGITLRALKEYFFSRLVSHVSNAGGNESLVQDWTIEIANAKGSEMGVIDFSYVDGKQKVHANILDVLITLALYKKPGLSTRTIGRAQLALQARDTLERLNVSQLLCMCGNRADEVQIQSGIVNMTVRSTEDQNAFLENIGATDPILKQTLVLLEADHSAPRPTQTLSVNAFDERSLFSFGSITVLSWGRILSDLPAFHTGYNLYPLGFKCIRMECDIKLNRMVECLCEIGAMPDPNSSSEKSKELAEIHARLAVDPFAPVDDISKLRDVVPLFRVTVGWIIGPDLQEPCQKTLQRRIYQGLSPEDVWTAAMTETLGLKKDQQPLVEGEDNGEKQQGEDSMDFEGLDAVESALRHEIATKRQKYFTAVREQLLLQSEAPLSARLSIDETTSFVDTTTARLMEGMVGSENCKDYVFYGNRNMDTGLKKEREKGFAKQHVKAYSLNRAIVDKMPVFSRGPRNGTGQYLWVSANEKDSPLKSPTAGKGKTGTERSKKAKGASPPAQAPGAVDAPLAGKGSRGGKFTEKSRGASTARANKPSYRGDKDTQILLSINNSATADNIIVTDETSAAQKAKAKEFERIVRAHRENFTKGDLKKRLNKSKVILQQLCDREEIAYKEKLAEVNTDSDDMKVEEEEDKARPLAPHNIIRMPGRLCTPLFEIWEFMTTFHKILKIEQLPTIEHMTKLFKSVDPTYSINDYLPMASAISAQVTGNASQQLLIHQQRYSIAILTEMCRTLSAVLRRDYEKLMGMDSSMAFGAYGEDNAEACVPVNILTWQEIAYVSLVAVASKECGNSDNDTLSNFKGKGYNHTPDNADKRLMSLLRKRIVFKHQIRDDYQESVYGYASGVISKLPSPPLYNVHIGIQWRLILLHLIHGFEGCYIYDVINKAHDCLDGFNESKVESVRKVLCSILNDPHLNIEDMSQTRKIALNLVVKNDTGTSEEYMDVITSSMDMATIFVSNVDEDGILPDSVYTDLIEKETNIVVQVGKISGVSLDLSTDRLSHIPMKAHHLLTRSRRLQQCQAPSELVTVDEHNRLLSVGLTLAEQNVIIAKEKEANAMSGIAPLEDEEEENAEEGEEDGDLGVVSDRATRRNQPWRYNPNYTDVLDTKEAAIAALLPLAARRCYAMVSELMKNPTFITFNYPVDNVATPQYYQIIPQPLCLYDIRRSLLTGEYNGNLTAFYKDCMLIFENAMSYNPENTAINAIAYKCVFIFERQFLERVLSWDFPLVSNQYCNQCKSANPLELMRRVICERCESQYHMSCCVPEMHRLPKGDWICFNCVQQRDVAAVHPNKNAVVVHPDSVSRRGEVVGIEQIHQTLTFVVSFSVGSNDTKREEREMWNAAKVRKQSIAYQEYLLEQIYAATGESKKDYETLCAKHDGGTPLPHVKVGVAPFDAASGVPTTLLELYLCREHWTPRMIEGYDIDDFDEVCNYARGYTNYAASHSLVPVQISDGHNIKAREVVDPAFETYRAAIATLSMHSPTTIRGSAEWVTLIRSLVQRAMLLPEVIIATNEYDTETEKATRSVTKLFENGAKGIDAYIRPTDVIHGEILKAEDTFRGANDVNLANIMGLAAAQVPEEELILGANPMELETEGVEAQAGDLDSLATVSEEAYAVRNAGKPKPKYTEADEMDEEEVEWGGEAAVAAPIKTEEVIDSIDPLETEGGVEGIADLPVKEEGEGDGAQDDDTISETSTVSDFIKFEDEGVKEETSSDAGEMGHSIEAKDVAIIDAWDEEELRALAAAFKKGENSIVSLRILFQQIIAKMPQNLQSAYPRRIEAIKRVARKSFHPIGSAYYINEFDAFQLLFELRRLSRCKGRDDALYFIAFIGDLMENVSNFADTVEEQQEFKCLTYNLVLTTIIKSCMPRVSDAYDVESWTGTWKAAIDQFYQSNLLMVDSGHPRATHMVLEESRVCAFCEQQECYLGSHFVRGESWDEWEARMEKRAAIKRGLLEDENANLNYKEKSISQLRFRAVDLSSHLAGTVQCLDSWLDAAKNGSQWKSLSDSLLASDELDMQTRHELESLHTCMHPPAAGSLVVHECCMENIHQMRLVAYERSRKRDDFRLINTLVSIGRTKTSPLGYDRHGNRYWMFPGSKKLYVSQRDADFDVDVITRSIYDAKTMSTEGMTGKIELYNQMSQSSSQKNKGNSVASLASLESTSQTGSSVPSLPENAVGRISDKSSGEVKEHFENMTAKYLVNCGITPSGSIASNLIWSCYESSEDIRALIKYLDTYNAKERQLRKTLLLLYPNIENDRSMDVKEEVTDSKEERLIETEKKNVKDSLYKVGDVVDVRDRNSSVLWSADVIDVKKVFHFAKKDGSAGKEKNASSTVKEEATYTIYYQVQYHNWPQQYKVWTVAECMQPPLESNGQSMDIDEESLSSEESYDTHGNVKGVPGESTVAVDADKSQDLLYRQVCNNLPDPISSLRAASFLHHSDDKMLEKINYSDATIDNPVAMMRCALLTVYTALPYASLDEHEERWGKEKSFHEPWIEAVAQAKNATDIVQCLLMLEMSIKNSYRKAAGTKIMQCLSSRLVCLRRASIGLAALRLWCLDASIRYDKKSLE